LPPTSCARDPHSSGSNQRGSTCRNCVESNRIAPYSPLPRSSWKGVRLSVASNAAMTMHRVQQAVAQVPEAPRSISLLRLSALGDVTHVLPLVHTLRSAWPEVALTWVIGTGEHRLLQGLPGVEFLVYDKKSGLAGMRALRRELHGRRFDALLQMQVAARA